jgi:hypothetical protein
MRNVSTELLDAGAQADVLLGARDHLVDRRQLGSRGRATQWRSRRFPATSSSQPRWIGVLSDTDHDPVCTSVACADAVSREREARLGLRFLHHRERFRVLYGFVILALERRAIVHVGVTEHPTAQWTAQRLAEAIGDHPPPRFLLHDRDGIYGASAFADWAYASS